jgi:uncharacterized protein YlxP (DUF503 family)
MKEDLKIKAKKDVLKRLISEMKSKYGEPMKEDLLQPKAGLQKVTVLAKDKNALQEGLEKAHDLVGEKDQLDEHDQLSPDEDENEESDLLKAMMKKLYAKK